MYSRSIEKLYMRKGKRNKERRASQHVSCVPNARLIPLGIHSSKNVSNVVIGKFWSSWFHSNR